ncbi:hypothetical protein BJ170DRAFT_643682 [Xylariales sp. AK1849]|nr:hypothetical protein BJ170DRAFT_643682 [Xylariales sp. AK1849]
MADELTVAAARKAAYEAEAAPRRKAAQAQIDKIVATLDIGQKRLYELAVREKDIAFAKNKALLNALTDSKPSPPFTWGSPDLVSHPAFDRVYQSFLDLRQGSRPKQRQQVQDLVRTSQRLLRDAFQALSLDDALATPPPELFSEDRRPTYIDYPPTSLPFIYGAGHRRGTLALLRSLGGTVTSELQATEDALRKEESAKRKKHPTEPTPEPKRPKGTPHAIDNYTLEHADADIQRLRYEAGIAKDEPDTEIPTMTLGIPDATLDNYQADFRAVIRNYRLEYQEALAVTRKAEARNLTGRLSDDIEEARERIREYRTDHPTSTYYNKQARIEAFRLKYLRSLCVRVAIATSSRPAHAVRRRYRDWITYERAWNTADELVIQRRRANGKQATNNAYQERVTQRNANIADWTRQLRAHGQQSAEPGQDDPIPAESGPDEGTALVGIDFGSVNLQDLLGADAPDGGIAAANGTETRLTLAANFAHGGPPHHDEHPLDTVYHRLQYMIIITHWRCLQARPLLPTAPTTE